jgi:predicted flap endonuclease-1-like 5' DNA nuclease
MERSDNIMRKWLWSLLITIFGFVFGFWWLRDRQATTPALQEEKPQIPKRPKPTTPQTHSAAEANEPDALTEINGIGPAFEKALNALGIYSYAQLAQQSPEDLAERLDVRVTAERIARDEWIEQAKHMARSQKAD